MCDPGRTLNFVWWQPHAEGPAANLNLTWTSRTSLYLLQLAEGGFELQDPTACISALQFRQFWTGHFSHVWPGLGNRRRSAGHFCSTVHQLWYSLLEA